MTPVIDCGLCILRPWRLSDAASLVTHANDRDIWLNLRDRFPHPYRQEHALHWLTHAAAEPPSNLAITVADEAVGSIGIQMHEDVDRTSAEIGYWLGRKYWGQGIVTAALRGMTRYAFETFELTRIYAVPYAHNAASARVLEKAGYTLEGRLRRSAIKDGVVLDQLLYAVTDQDVGLRQRDRRASDR